MTAPFAQLPHVDLGNAEQDVGGALSGLAAGLVKQKNFNRQQALAEALGQARIGLEGAQQGETEALTPPKVADLTAHTAVQNSQTNVVDPTIAAHNTAAAGLATAQTAGLEHENEPADLEQHGYIHQLSPSYIPDMGLTRKEADSRIHDLSLAKLTMDRYGLVQGRFDQGKVLDQINKFKSDPEVKSAIGTAQGLRNTNILLNSGAPIIQPSLLLDISQALAIPGQPNARAIGTELAQLLKGSTLSYSQRVQQFLNKLTTEGDQFTLDPESLQAIKEIMPEVAKTKVMRYRMVREDLKNTIKGVLGVDLSDKMIGSDPFGDLDAQLNAAPTVSGPQDPQSNPAEHL